MIKKIFQTTLLATCLFGIELSPVHGASKEGCLAGCHKRYKECTDKCAPMPIGPAQRKCYDDCYPANQRCASDCLESARHHAGQ